MKFFLSKEQWLSAYFHCFLYFVKFNKPEFLKFLDFDIENFSFLT